MKLICATGNSQKFGIGQTILKDFGIELVQVPVDIDEIQGEDPERVLRDNNDVWRRLGAFLKGSAK